MFLFQRTIHPSLCRTDITSLICDLTKQKSRQLQTLSASKTNQRYFIITRVHNWQKSHSLHSMWGQRHFLCVLNVHLAEPVVVYSRRLQPCCWADGLPIGQEDLWMKNDLSVKLLLSQWDRTEKNPEAESRLLYVQSLSLESYSQMNLDINTLRSTKLQLKRKVISREITSTSPPVVRASGCYCTVNTDSQTWSAPKVWLFNLQHFR